MADTSNLSQYLKDVASAIKEKTGKTLFVTTENYSVCEVVDLINDYV